MIRTARAFFLSRLLREMALLAGLVVIVAALWLSSLSARAARMIHSMRATSSSLGEQHLWLSQRAAIQASAESAAGRLDAVQTLDATRLLAEVAAIASDVGLKNTTTSPPKDVTSGQFSVHTLEFNISKVDWNTLKQFYLSLSKKSPYIGIEQYVMQVDRSNPTLLDANFQISSVEIARN